MIDKFIQAYCKSLKVAIALALAVMVVLVFGNVVLRYAFNTGISVSEELSRWLFVWITFMGAVVAMNEHGHLGTDMLVGKLGPMGKKICLGIAYVGMLFCCWLMFKGSLEQTKINWTTTSAVMETSVGYFYASGVVFSVLGSLILLRELLRLLTGKVKDKDLVIIQETEEHPGHNADAQH